MQHILGYYVLMKIPTLETKRLILRPVSIDDAPAIQKYFNNWNIIKNLSTAAPWPYPDNGAETFLCDIALPAMKKGEACVWGILSKEEGATEVIGIVDYRKTATPDGGNRGFWLAEPFWGQGYMTEAVEAVQDYLFFDLEIDHIIVTNVKSNPASRRIKEKTGARFLRIEENDNHHADNKETEVWEVTREGWISAKNAITV